MSMEMESMWDAMKGVYYQRTIDQLEKSLENVKKLEDALGASLDTVVTAIHAEAGTLWYYDQFGDGRIRPKAVYGGGDLGGISLLPGEGIAGQVIQSGEPVIIPDCQKDPRWAGKVDAKTGFQTKSMICVPLALDQMTFGSIQIINKTDNSSFDEKDLTFAQQLASAASELFRRQGLLDDYIDAAVAAGVRKPASQVNFLQVFGAADDREMEHQLRRLEEFATLRVPEQEAVLKLAREMRTFFGGKRGGSGRRMPWRR